MKQYWTFAAQNNENHLQSFPRALGLAEHYDDLEDLTTEKPDVNERLRKEAIWKASNAYYKHRCMIRWYTERTKHLQLQGTLVLLGGITLHMFISSIYHLATTGWNYGDVWVLRTSLGEKLHFGFFFVIAGTLWRQLETQVVLRVCQLLDHRLWRSDPIRWGNCGGSVTYPIEILIKNACA